MPDLADDGYRTVHLITRGARSGSPRRVEIWAHDSEGGIFLVGSNWGKTRHPGWYHNIVVTPRVVLEIDDQNVVMEARIAHGAERDRLFALAAEHCDVYHQFAESAGREIPVVVLESAAS